MMCAGPKGTIERTYLSVDRLKDKLMDEWIVSIDDEMRDRQVVKQTNKQDYLR